MNEKEREEKEAKELIEEGEEPDFWEVLIRQNTMSLQDQMAAEDY